MRLLKWFALFSHQPNYVSGTGSALGSSNAIGSGRAIVLATGSGIGGSNASGASLSFTGVAIRSGVITSFPMLSGTVSQSIGSWGTIGLSFDTLEWIPLDSLSWDEFDQLGWSCSAAPLQGSITSFPLLCATISQSVTLCGSVEQVPIPCGGEAISGEPYTDWDQFTWEDWDQYTWQESDSLFWASPQILTGTVQQIGE